VNNIGLVEVPMGTSLKTIVYEIGGGIPNNRKFKAVQLAGLPAGVFPCSSWTRPRIMRRSSRQAPSWVQAG